MSSGTRNTRSLFSSVSLREFAATLARSTRPEEKKAHRLLLAQEKSGRISSAIIREIGALLTLSSRERHYLSALARYSVAKTPKTRHKYLSAMVHTLEGSPEPLSTAHQSLYRAWYIPVVWSLTGIMNITGKKSDFTRLAAAIRPGISPEQAKSGFETLCALDLVQKDHSGRFKPHPRSLSNLANCVTSRQTGRFLDSMMRLAIRARTELPHTDREISSLTLGLSHRLFNEIRREIADLRRSIAARASRDSRPQRVVQCNFQLFPVGVASKGELA